jgi:hypothetical protein
MSDCCFHGSFVLSRFLCFDTARSLDGLCPTSAPGAMSSGKEGDSFRPKVRSGDVSLVHDIA